jgi:hypothetical protein
MNNKKKEIDNRTISMSTVLACIFNNEEIKYSPKFINIGKFDEKDAYKVEIEYIRQLLVALIYCVPDLRLYNIDENNINSNNIKKAIDSDKKLITILRHTKGNIIYTGEYLDPYSFIDNNIEDLKYIVWKIGLYSQRLISENSYGKSGLSESGHSK